MKCAILGSMDQFLSELSILLLENGIEPYFFENTPENLNNYQVVFIDEVFADEVKNSEIEGSSIIITEKAQTETGERKTLKKASSHEAVTGFIKKLAEKLPKTNDMRKHVRVKPDRNELMRVHYDDKKQKKKIIGKVIDISLGGFAAELLNVSDLSVIDTGTRINPITITMATGQIEPSGYIVNKRKRFVAVNFTSFVNKDRHSLARYIIQRLNAKPEVL
ncbi:MAG: hypothetical protein ACLFR1_01545 [Spirochaetia bacterium]